MNFLSNRFRNAEYAIAALSQALWTIEFEYTGMVTEDVADGIWRQLPKRSKVPNAVMFFESRHKKPQVKMFLFGNRGFQPDDSQDACQLS